MPLRTQPSVWSVNNEAIAHSKIFSFKINSLSQLLEKEIGAGTRAGGKAIFWRGSRYPSITFLHHVSLITELNKVIANFN